MSRSKTDYSKLDKEELIDHIRQLEKRRKYGLVWDEESTREEFEEEAQNSFPVLVDEPQLTIKNDPNQPTHILIEGDNFHALSVLNYTHEKLIDVIYIDPPYNTGNTSWKYNNRFIERDDAYKHSKWLSFMHKRLKLAKDLLSDKGAIIVAIDDYEHHTLRFLMDDLFGEENRMGTITVVHNPRGRNDDKFLATMHEYLLVYAKNKDLANVGYFELEDEDIDKYNKSDEISTYNETSFMRTGNNSDRSTRPNLYYPIYYDPGTNNLSLREEKGSVKLLPINGVGEEKTWRWGTDTFEKLWKTELLVRKVKDIYRIFKKRRVTNIKGKKPKTVWYDPRYDASTYGIMVLQKIFGHKNVFPYPKSLYAILDIIKLTSRKNSIILDFFAGSGTTAHAVMELNEEDGGNRQCILVTNNENDIMTDVCYPRVQKVIQGYAYEGKDKTLLFENKVTLTQMRKGNEIYAEYQVARDENNEIYDELQGEFKDNTIRLWGLNNTNGWKEGLGGNLKYYNTAFVPSDPTDGNKIILTYRSVEMLCLRENTFDLVAETDIWKIYENQTQYTGILFDQLSIPEFKTALAELNVRPISIYVFSLGDDNFASEFADMGEHVNARSIPEAILRAYRRIYKRN